MKSNPAPTEANPQGAREDPYPDPRGGFLARLEELGDILAHLAQLQLPPVPQQLYPRDRQLQQRLAVPRRNGISSQNETRNSLWVPRTRGPAQSKGGEEGRGGREGVPLCAAEAAALAEEGVQHRHGGSARVGGEESGCLCLVGSSAGGSRFISILNGEQEGGGVATAGWRRR
jgi:hypothetical protein